MTSKQIESRRIHTLSHEDTPAEATWEIALQLAIQAEHQAETVKLLTRSIELQEVVHLARPAELETLRNRVDELLNANNAEVERRREAEKQCNQWKESGRQAWALYEKAKGELGAAEQEIINLKKDRAALARALKDPQQGKMTPNQRAIADEVIADVLADPQQSKRDAVSERRNIADALRACAQTIEENHLGQRDSADYIRQYAATVEYASKPDVKDHCSHRDEPKVSLSRERRIFNCTASGDPPAAPAETSTSTKTSSQQTEETLSQPQWTADGPFQKQGENKL